MDTTKAINRAQQAESIMRNEVMIEAKEHIEAEIYRLFRSLPPTDTEGLQQVKAMQYMHEKYLAYLNSCLNDGKMAKMEIERKRKSLKDRFFG